MEVNDPVRIGKGKTVWYVVGFLPRPEYGPARQVELEAEVSAPRGYGRVTRRTRVDVERVSPVDDREGFERWRAMGRSEQNAGNAGIEHNDTHRDIVL